MQGIFVYVMDFNGGQAMNITDEKNILSNPNTDYDLDEYDSLMEESEKWAKEVGMKQSDIDDAFKSIRKKGSH